MAAGHVNFPTNYWKFCRELRNNGLNVLGVGDQPYGELSQFTACPAATPYIALSATLKIPNNQSSR